MRIGRGWDRGWVPVVHRVRHSLCSTGRVSSLRPWRDKCATQHPATLWARGPVSYLPCHSQPRRLLDTLLKHP